MTDRRLPAKNRNQYRFNITSRTGSTRRGNIAIFPIAVKRKNENEHKSGRHIPTDFMPKKVRGIDTHGAKLHNGAGFINFNKQKKEWYR